jgi:methyl-accepting chemotaxis protein
MISFAIFIIGCVVLVAVVAILGVSKLDDSFVSLQKHEITTKIETIKIGREVNYVSRLTRNIMLGADFNKDMKRLDETAEKITKSFDLLIKSAEGDEERKMAEVAKVDTLAFVSDGKSRMQALKDTPTEQRYTAFKEYEKGATPLAMKSRGSFDAIIKKADSDFDGKVKLFESTLHKTFKLIVSASVIAVIVVAAAFLVLIRLIFTPIEQLKTGLATIRSSWDLTSHLDDSRKDEMGAIARETNAFIGALREVIGAVSGSTGRVAMAASGLTGTATQMATSIEEVAAQASTVATASEEMSATTIDIANNCNRAAELSNNARDVAAQGAAVVRETVAGMERITRKVKESASTVESLGARSDQIGAIVGTIEDIADQTNLLALNAAIEAARAGEMGRGFAVVADEVRALAERTTKATREIGEMIKAIQQETKGAVSTMEEGVHEVELGTNEAAKSGTALDEIMERINDLSMQVHQIATAAEEQSATVGEITTNIHQISDVIHSTNQGTQETAQAAQDLNGLADELRRAVAQFRL